MIDRANIERWNGLWARLHRDERGTALTEFIILLPIFVLVFVGVVNLTELNRTAIRVSGEAYSDMWDKAIEIQTEDPGVHTKPGPSGDAVQTNMGVYTGLQQEQGPRQIVSRETNHMGNDLAGRGHMGESFQRVERARNYVELRHIDADLTQQLPRVTGESQYALRLFNDGSTASPYYPNHGGPLSALDSKINGSGLRPVLAAGIRYGSVVGHSKDQVDVGPTTIELKHYATILVAPHWRREDTATAVARTALDGISAYDNLLGIAEDQPLDQESIDVPKIEGAF